MIPFIDIHTHFENSDAEVIAVLNYTQKEGFALPNLNDTLSKSQTPNPKSIGLHPWFLTKGNFESDYKKLAQHIYYQDIIALGECGLDRLKGADLVFQIQAFEAQIRLAESVKKPVIIHCVKAYNEVISLKRKLKPIVPMIIHGFNQNENILKDLVRNGFYMSIGAAVLLTGSNSEKSLNKIPLERLFFETDDKEVSIKGIYEKAAEILKLEINELKRVVLQNYEYCFKKLEK
jgi:TatD DNase family protein